MINRNELVVAMRAKHAKQKSLRGGKQQARRGGKKQQQKKGGAKKKR